MDTISLNRLGSAKTSQAGNNTISNSIIIRSCIKMVFHRPFSTERRNAYVKTTQDSSSLFLLCCLGAMLLSLSSTSCHAQEPPQPQQQTMMMEQQQPQQPQQQQTLPFSSCIQDIRQIYEEEIKYEQSKIINNNSGSSVNIDFNNDLDIDLDVNDIRTYVLCPGMTYNIARLDFNYRMIPTTLTNTVKDNPPLILKPNIHYKCGDNGLRSNLCIIQGGDVQISDGTSFRPPVMVDNESEESNKNLVFGPESSSSASSTQQHLGSNIRFTGLTFMDTAGTSFWSTKPGLITFVDCEWTMHTNAIDSIIKLDFYDNNGSGTSDDHELVVRMENCLFFKNRLSSVSNSIQSSLITVNNEQNTLYVLSTMFEQNDMKWNLMSTEEETHLIESLGIVFMDNCCFIDNRVTSSDVAMYGNQLVSQQIFSMGSEGTKCAFGSLYETVQQYETRQPICVGTTSPSCGLDDASSAISTHHQSITNANNGDTDVSYQISRYIPFVVNALAYDDVFETGVDTTLGNCYIAYPNDETGGGVDASLIGDDDEECSATGPCTISNTETGEYFDYRFGHFQNMESVNGLVNVVITVRVSSNISPKKFNLEILTPTGNVQYSQQFASAGFGWDTYTDVTWSNVTLMASNQMHTLRFFVVNGGINFCSVKVSYSDGQFNDSSTTNTNPEVGSSAIDVATTAEPASTAVPEATTPSTSTTDPISVTSESTMSPTGMNSSPDPTTPTTTTTETNSPSCSDPSDFVCDAKDNVPEDKIFDALVWACDPRQNILARLDCNALFLNNDIDPFGTDYTAMAKVVFQTYWVGLDRVDGACCFDESKSGNNCIAETKCPQDKILPPAQDVDQQNSVGTPSPPSNSSAVQTPSAVTTLIVPGTYSAMSFSEISGQSSSVSESPLLDVDFNSANENGGDPECLPQPKQQHNSDGSLSSLVAFKVDYDPICSSVTTNIGSDNDETQKHCAVSTTQPNDYVEYEFLKDPTKSEILVTTRMSSFGNSVVKIEVMKSSRVKSTEGQIVLVEEMYASVPGSSDWTDYSSYILWDSLEVGNDARYKLRFTLVEGSVRMCSVGVAYALGVV
mmetsp:Transcript_4248/g.10595  ORF Transcript_4248/g.10595 Transcript_4248/m.10595 type:complete len:1077 (-) Transcript_4248:847-4077(-)